MTPCKLRYRLREQARFFKHETELIKGKVRELYKLAEDAISLCEQLHANQSPPKISGPAKPVVYYKAPPPPEKQSQADRLKAFLANGFDTPEAKRFFKWSRITPDEARKIIAEGESKG